MNYQEFLNAVVDCVKEIVGKEAEVFIHRVTKLNGVVLDGVVIMKNDTNFSPTVYLNGYYAMYLSGCEVEEIAQKIYKLYVENSGIVSIPADFFTDFERIRDNIAFRLINYERNRELLEKIPHRRFLNLAIVYFAVIDNADNARGIVTIYNNHLEYWKIDEELLYRLAAKNTPSLYPPQIRPMNQVVSDMILREEEDMDVDSLITQVESMNEQFPMYVLTNIYRSYGAACMLYEGLLEEFTAHIEADVYIIPSSVHELILIPVDGDITREELDDMIKNINMTELSTDEILSDCAYIYTRENGFEWRETE